MDNNTVVSAENNTQKNADNDIEVTVVCCTYNHEPYIREALEGFVMQKTNFKFIVLVHDDASTDKTADIIREYEKKYPNIIKPIYENENQYSKGGSALFNAILPHVRGKYRASCEGDDYWLDPLKLQKQYDAMEAHPEVDMCAHATWLMESATKEYVHKISPSNQQCIIPARDVITGGGGFVATSSLFFRNTLNENIPEFRRILRLDYALQVQGALRGGMLYLPDIMSVYRIRSVGSWSCKMQSDVKAVIAHRETICKAYKSLNDETKFKYADIINLRILINEFEILKLQRKCRTLLSRKYADVFKAQPIKTRIKILGGALLQPFLRKEY